MTLHLVCAILVERWRCHHIDLRLAFEIDKRLNQVGVINCKIFLVPLIGFAIVCTEHDHNEIRLVVECIFVSLLVPVGPIALAQGSAATDAKVFDLIV